MTPPFASSTLRLAIGVALALLSVTLAAIGLTVSLTSLTLPGFGGAVPNMKANASAALLAACAAWFALQARVTALHLLGYALVALVAAIAGATLAEHFAKIDLGVDTLIAADAANIQSGAPGRMSAAAAFSLALTAFAIALTRFERAEDLRQFLRVAALAVQLFAVALYVYDPDAISAINGFEATALNTSIALALLLVAIGFDRAAASLRWQLATIGVIVVAPLVALTVHFASAERGNALAAAQDRLAVVARLGAERQDAVIAQTRQMLTLLARSERVKSAGDACNLELAEYAPLYPWVKSLYVVDRDGVVRCGNQTNTVGISVRDRAYVREAFETGEFTISGFVRARVSGQPRIVLAMPSPQGPGVERLIAASVDVEGLAGPLKGLADDAARGETITLVDMDGLVIARRPRADGQIGANLADATFVTEALANPDRPYVAAELDGRQTVFQARRVLDGRGTLIVGVPRREIVRPVDDRLNNQLLLIASILAGSFALGLLGSEALVLRPVRKLIGYAGRLEAGDLAARPNVRASGEIGALGRALAVSAASIEDRERRLVGAEALFRGLFDHSPDAKCVIRVEPDGGFKVETWNAAAEEATGLTAGAVLGRSPSAVFPGARGEAIERDLRRTLALGRVQIIEREPKVDGLPTVFEMVQVPLRGPDGMIERIFISARDISERKRVERLKNEFVSTVSHELRTPLTSIAGSLGLLAGGAAGAMGDRAKHLITIAHSNSLRLVRLINDILDIEKIEAGRMTFELRSLELGDVVRQSIADIRSYADQYGVELELAPGGEGLMVHGDEDRLVQVVTNLLSNAIKFSPQGERVTASIQAEGEAVTVIVKDRGPGIPEAFRPRLFTKFAQADGSDSRRKGGTGLGLAIVREIVERHAGAVSFRTELGVGTAFEVRLPRHVALARGAAPTFADHSPRQKVLVCEDDALIAAIIAEQLREAGFEALTVGTVRAALQAVDSEEVDAALVDLNLPDGDGLDLIREIRALPKGSALPVVVVSASAEMGRRDERAAKLDVADWVEKPVDVARLARLLRRRVTSVGRPRVLHVEDDADLCNVVSAALSPFADIVSAGGVAAARRLLAMERFDLAILDVSLDDGSGLDLLNSMTAGAARRVPVVVFSARDADRDTARAEAALTKSRTSLATLVETVRRILAESKEARDESLRSYG